MTDFECELTDDGDVLVRHLRQGHEFFLVPGNHDVDPLTVSRTVRGPSALDDPEAYADGALAFAGQQRMLSR